MKQLRCLGGYYIQTTSSLGRVTQSISENRLERESDSKYLPTSTQEKLTS